MTFNIEHWIHSGGLFATAFVHKSVNTKDNFEKLEFLGDSILGLRAAFLLYKKYDEANEGSLSKWKSALVSQTTLAKIGRKLKLTDFLICSEDQKEPLVENERIQASLVESLIGALYLEKGWSAAYDFIDFILEPHLIEVASLFSEQDPKTKLQEWVQREFKTTPVYEKVSEKGPSHNPEFVVRLTIKSEKSDLIFEGSGRSLKQAEKKIAEQAYEQIKNNGVF